jgi:N-acetylglutamate synthase-like GNAT family acetyltransferase
VKETEKNIVVREADSGDASAVAGLYRQLVSTLAPDKHVNVLEERLAEIRSDQNNFLWVLERSGNVLGTAFLTLCLDPMYSRQPFALLDNMVIEQSQQDNGYGETLLSHIERLCEQGIAQKSCCSAIANADLLIVFFSVEVSLETPSEVSRNIGQNSSGGAVVRRLADRPR